MNIQIVTGFGVSFAMILLAGISTGCDGKRVDPPVPSTGSSATASSIPVYVTPFYDSKGPQISVGEYSKKLAAADSHTIGALCEELKTNRDTLRAEVMYVAAIRLYDLGQKDEAVYWFYTAQYRAHVFGSILDQTKTGSMGSEAFELQQAYSAFNQLAGEYINGYAFGDLPKLERTLALVIDENKSIPKFGDLYPKVDFVDAAKWPEQNEKASTGLAGLIEHIKANADSIREQRRKNGVDGKF